MPYINYKKTDYKRKILMEKYKKININIKRKYVYLKECYFSFSKSISLLSS